MVTALQESENIIEALGMGANDYITKPLDYPVALARIRSQLGRRRNGEALLESAQRSALAARGFNDGLWDWDLKTGHVHYSTRWKPMLDLEDADLGSEPEDWFNRIHAEDRPGLKGGGYALGRWTLQLTETSEFKIQAFFSEEHRMEGAGRADLDTLDAELDYSSLLGKWPNRSMEVSFGLQNLLDNRYPEFVIGPHFALSSQVQRSASGKVFSRF
jgi:PAS domain-containing protein